MNAPLILEEFAPLKGYEGLYEISTFGTVTSLARTTSPECGKKQTTKSRVISQQDNGHGYKTVRLYKENKQRIAYVHRLVLETFIGECPKGMEACHNNGYRWHNHLSNLRWDTKAGNHADKFAHGTIRNGEKARAAKLTAEKVIEIRNRIYGGAEQDFLARAFGVSQSSISDIATRKTWKHI